MVGPVDGPDHDGRFGRTELREAPGRRSCRHFEKYIVLWGLDKIQADP